MTKNTLHHFSVNRNLKKAGEICSMCKRPKSQHTNEELSACIHKMQEFKEQKKGGAGIQ